MSEDIFSDILEAIDKAACKGICADKLSIIVTESAFNEMNAKQTTTLPTITFDEFCYIYKRGLSKITVFGVEAIPAEFGGNGWALQRKSIKWTR